MPLTNEDFKTFDKQSETFPFDAPPPGEDEDFDEYIDRIKADWEVRQDEIWQQRNGWVI